MTDPCTPRPSATAGFARVALPAVPGVRHGHARRGRRSRSTSRPASTVGPGRPRCPIRSARYQQDFHQAVGATRRPFCFARHADRPTHRPTTPNRPPTHATTTTFTHETRRIGDVRHPAFQRGPTSPREPDWQELARCNDGTGSMTELFFSEQLDDIAAAKAFCLECPVQEPCLEGAVSAARAVGRLGRRAVRERQDRRPEAQAGPAAEGAPRGRGGTDRADGLIAPAPDRRAITRRAGTTRPGCTPRQPASASPGPPAAELLEAPVERHRGSGPATSAPRVGLPARHLLQPRGSGVAAVAVQQLGRVGTARADLPRGRRRAVDAAGGRRDPWRRRRRRARRHARVRNAAATTSPPRTCAAPHAAVELARAVGATRAVLKARSPSCGAVDVYDGTFTRTLRAGVGRHGRRAACRRHRGRLRRRARASPFGDA